LFLLSGSEITGKVTARQRTTGTDVESDKDIAL